MDTVLANIIKIATKPYEVPQSAAWTLDRGDGTRIWGTEELFMLILQYNRKTNKQSINEMQTQSFHGLV